jgi:hypothetical protein
MSAKFLSKTQYRKKTLGGTFYDQVKITQLNCWSQEVHPCYQIHHCHDYKIIPTHFLFSNQKRCLCAARQIQNKSTRFMQWAKTEVSDPCYPSERSLPMLYQWKTDCWYRVLIPKMTGADISPNISRSLNITNFANSSSTLMSRQTIHPPF